MEIWGGRWRPQDGRVVPALKSTVACAALPAVLLSNMTSLTMGMRMLSSAISEWLEF